MHEWCQREDFRAALPALLQGEAPGFVATIGRIAEASTKMLGWVTALEVRVRP